MSKLSRSVFTTTTEQVLLRMDGHISMRSSLEQKIDTRAHIEGALNFRDFGGYSSNASQHAITRKAFIYRSGHLSNITNKGWERIRELHISTIICLASTNEAKALYASDRQGSEKLKGFKIIHLPFYQKEFDKTRLFTKYSAYASEGHNVRLYSLISKHIKF